MAITLKNWLIGSQVKATRLKRMGEIFDKFVTAEQIEVLKQHFAGVTQIGGVGQRSDISKTPVFLAFDDSSFMLGAELLVDAGMTYLSK